MTTVSSVTRVTEAARHGSRLCPPDALCWDCSGAREGARALVKGFVPEATPGPLFIAARKEATARALAYWIVGETAKAVAYRRVLRVLVERAW